MLYIQEKTRLLATKIDEFLEAADKEQIPLNADTGLRLVAYWETVRSQGYWPEVISLWELDDFPSFADVNSKRYSDGSLGKRYRQWQEHLGTLATASRGVLFWPSSHTPTLEQIKLSGKRASICVHESVTTTPNKSREYIEQLQKLWTPVAERHGRWMVGTYTEIWHNTQATNIWALEDWEALGKYQSKMGGDDDAHTWVEVGMALRHDWDDRLLVSLPFSPI